MIVCTMCTLTNNTIPQYALSLKFYKNIIEVICKRPL